MDYDFCGWVTKNNIRCTDGLTILQDAFQDDDGRTVPLVWMHDHADPTNTLGHVYLENRDTGVYGFGKFNNTEKAKHARECVDNGDIVSMSIFAGGVKKNGNYVVHGDIKEVSLVVAGANPGAKIENVIAHSDGESEWEQCDLYLNLGNNIGIIEHSDDDDNDDDDDDEEEIIEHADEETIKDILDSMNEKQKNVMYFLIGKALEEAKKGVKHSDNPEEGEIIEHSDDGEETVADIVNSMNDKQRKVMEFLIGKAIEDNIQNGGKTTMRHNVFENNEEVYEGACISHADQEMILAQAKKPSVGTFKQAMQNYIEEHKDTLSHGFEDITQLFPDWHDEMTGAPEAIPEDLAWVGAVVNGVSKSPFARVRTRQADISAIKAKGYPEKGAKKEDIANVKLVMRTTDPQTIYAKETLDRDDVADITDFDVVAYEQGLMRNAVQEKIATCILIGDGLEDVDPDKVHEEHIRSVWHDNDLYAIHYTVDFKKAKAEINGTNTAANFGENFYRAEALVTAALYSREQYKGRGKPDFFVTPHWINVVLLARDQNGRRIYNTVAEIAAALNVNKIHTVEEFAGKTRTAETNEGPKTMALVGIFLNMSDYQVGSTRKGELTSFDDFDIDFNQLKFLMETRLSGALTRVKSAIVLEEDVTA